MDSNIKQSYSAHSLNHYNTPVKELPPSLIYGSSSSPYYESSPVDQNFTGSEWSPSAIQRSQAISHQMARSMMSHQPGRHMSLDMTYDPSYTFSDDLNARRLSGPASFKSASFSQLLPSQFPVAENDELSYGTLGSSPPISQTGRYHQYFIDQTGSPKAKSKRPTAAKRGRPRKYSVNDNPGISAGEYLNSSPASAMQLEQQLHVSPSNGINGFFGISDASQQQIQPRLVRRPYKVKAKEPSKKQSRKKRAQDALNVSKTESHSHATNEHRKTPSQNVHGLEEIAFMNERLDKRRKLAASGMHFEQPKSTDYMGNLNTSDITPGRGVSIYTDKPTSNGVPLISANVFRKVCEMQGAKKRANLKSFLTDYRKHNTHHFSTNGMGFNFTIDTSGTASIDRTQAVPSSPHGPRRDGSSPDRDLDSRETPRIIDVLDEESDSDSETENDGSLPTSNTDPVRTPPRFSSLGSSDATTEFARTFGRSHDRGFMFLFPNESTPNKPVHLSSNNHLTPRTPRIPVPFDEDSFSLQMQTPPGAIFSSYDYQAGNFVTGMTPYINGLERVGANE